MDPKVKEKFNQFKKERGSSGVPARPADEQAGEDTPQDTESGFYDIASRLCTTMGVDDEEKHADVASLLMELHKHFLA